MCHCGDVDRSQAADENYSLPITLAFHAGGRTMPATEPGHIFCGGTECYQTSTPEMGTRMARKSIGLSEEFTILGSVWLQCARF